MKHLTYSCMGILFFISLLVSCEKKKSTENTNGFNLNSHFYSTSWAFGEKWNWNGQHVIGLYLLNSGITSISDGEPTGKGHLVAMTLIVPNSELVTGRFLFNTLDYYGNNDPYTCDAWILIDDGSEYGQEFDMIGGEINLTINGTKIESTYSMTLDNNLQLTGEYLGEIKGLNSENVNTEVYYKEINETINGIGSVSLDFNNDTDDDFLFSISGEIDMASIKIKALNSNQILCFSCTDDYLDSRFKAKGDPIIGNEIDNAFLKVPMPGEGNGIIHSEGYIGLRLYSGSSFMYGWIQVNVSSNGYSIDIIDGAYNTKTFSDISSTNEEFKMGDKE